MFIKRQNVIFDNTSNFKFDKKKKSSAILINKMEFGHLLAGLVVITRSICGIVQHSDADLATEIARPVNVSR